MPKTPRHYAGRQFFNISGLPFFAMRVPQFPHIFHDHDFFEIILVLDGNATHQIYGTKHKISKGDILIIPVHQDHAYLNTKNMEIINMLFDPTELEKVAFDLPKSTGYQKLILKSNSSSFPTKHKGQINIPTVKFAAVVSLLTSFISEIESKRTGYKAMAASLFIQAIGVIVRCREHINTPTLFLSRIEQTLDFIESHYNENISLDQLARLAHMSGSSFKRSFRKTMNTSPINHLIRFRIRKASSLLLCHPELNVTEIALHVGFSDSNYFSRMFRKITGHTPREFRSVSVMDNGRPLEENVPPPPLALARHSKGK